MSELVEMRTGSQISEVVDRLARTMGDESICLKSEKSIAEGEWVRFNVQLEDGTPVLEGVGRCTSTQVRGADADHYDLYLGELSFDERNEIMFERMLIAKDASAHGDDTGTIQLPDEDMESVSEPDQVTEAGPTRSVPPPPPASAVKAGPPPPLPPVVPAPSKGLSKERGQAPAPKKPSTRASTAPEGPSTPKPLASASAPEKRTGVAPEKRTGVAPEKRTSVAPKKRTSVAPKKRTSVAPTRGERAPTEAADGSTRVDLRAPDASDRAGALAVDEAQRKRAQVLAATMPQRMTRSAVGDAPEDAVLRKALAIGLAALEALEED